MSRFFYGSILACILISSISLFFIDFSAYHRPKRIAYLPKPFFKPQSPLLSDPPPPPVSSASSPQHSAVSIPEPTESLPDSAGDIDVNADNIPLNLSAEEVHQRILDLFVRRPWRDPPFRNAIWPDGEASSKYPSITIDRTPNFPFRRFESPADGSAPGPGYCKDAVEITGARVRHKFSQSTDGFPEGMIRALQPEPARPPFRRHVNVYAGFDSGSYLDMTSWEKDGKCAVQVKDKIVDCTLPCGDVECTWHTHPAFVHSFLLLFLFSVMELFFLLRIRLLPVKQRIHSLAGTEH